jgi:AmmeMemoRadiSam system protein A
MMLGAAQRQTLLAVARTAIGHGLEHRMAPFISITDYDPSLQQHASSFVTLRRKSALRGCIGSLEPHQPLVTDVAQHAYAAAFSDARFDRLQAEELGSLEIHISVLSRLEPVTYDGEKALLAALEPRVHGLVIELDGRRATFLPSVWSSFENGEQFLLQLKQKAGLDPEVTGYAAWRYTTEEFAEE